MKTKNMTLNEFCAMHPMPWRYVALEGQVQLFDAANQPVLLFTMLDFACSMTVNIAARPPKQEAA